MDEQIKFSLSKTQKEAIQYSDGPLLIVAGAGTGKTSVITEKIAYLINTKKAEPHEILALTFTEKAAGEMQERVDKLVQNPYLEVQIATFHAFCEQMLRHHGLSIGISSNFKIFTQIDAWLQLREHIYELELDYYRPLGNPTKYIHDFLNHFSKCKDELISTEQYLRYAEDLELSKDNANMDEKSRVTELANAYHVYNQMILDAGGLDFGDLVFYAVKLLREREGFATTFQQKYKYVLIDEFQDVNYGQYELVKLLAKYAQLTVVGDDDQSIYAFRGASVSNILRFKDDYKDAKEIVLTENFRSGQQILDAAYALIQHNNPDRLEAKLSINKKLISVQNSPASVNYLHFSTLEEEVRGVIDAIIEKKKKDTEATWDDFAILVRANSHAQPFIEQLDRRGLPYEFLAASGLYRQKVVLDALCIMKLLHNVHDSVSLYRILQLPFLEFPEKDLHKLLSYAEKKHLSYFELLSSPELIFSDEGRVIADKLVSLFKKNLLAASREKPSIVLFGILEEIGYLKYLTEQDSQNTGGVLLDALHLRQFFDFLESYQHTVPGATIHLFLEYHAGLLESGDEGALYEPGNTPDSINILTIHGAKGLEFKYVFLVNMVEDRFPTRRRSEGLPVPEQLIKEILPEGDAHYQEERRLCYVGITRAKTGLWLSSGENYGGARAKKPSRFLLEIGAKSPAAPKGQATIGSVFSQPVPEKMQTEKLYTLPSTFSFSQLKVYETCPYKYKLAHVLRLPARGSASLSFGQTMHATLQHFYERIKELNSAEQISLFSESPKQDAEPKKIKGLIVPTFEELIALYEKAWMKDWYKSKRQHDEYYAKGKDILKIFYTSQEENWTIPVALESYFKIKIGDESIKGRIDRVDQMPDGTLEIIDYKTGKTRETLDAEDKEQLLLYHIAATRLPSYRNMGETSTLSFYYLNDNLKVSFSGAEKEIEKLEQKLAGLIANIRGGDFKAKPSKFACGYCDFKEICEFRVL